LGASFTANQRISIFRSLLDSLHQNRGDCAMRLQGLALVTMLVVAGCAEPTPPAAKKPAPPPVVAPTPPTPAPAPAPIPPALIAKVDELTGLYKEVGTLSAAPADATDLDAIEKRLKATGELTAKIQKTLLEISAGQAQLTTEQQTEFVKQYGGKLAPPTPAIPGTP
jgi:hypothetical protein